MLINPNEVSSLRKGYKYISFLNHPFGILEQRPLHHFNPSLYHRQPSVYHRLTAGIAFGSSGWNMRMEGRKMAFIGLSSACLVLNMIYRGMTMLIMVLKKRNIV